MNFKYHQTLFWCRNVVALNDLLNSRIFAWIAVKYIAVKYHPFGNHSMCFQHLKTPGKRAWWRFIGELQYSAPFRILDSMMPNISIIIQAFIPFHHHSWRADFISETMNGMRTGKQVDAIYLNIEKHLIPLIWNFWITSIMGLNYQLLNWIHQYLPDR